MKKIFLLLTFVLGCLSSQAQITDIYNNGTLVNSYTNGGYNNYKVVIRENPSTDDSFPGDGAEHTVVDLGLSVKWAACNIGASSPYEDGNYYSWGETSPKDSYTSTTDKYCNCSDNNEACNNAEHFTKYNLYDAKTVLESADDAATVNWGTGFRMPTQAEFDELVSQCTWTWDSTHNGYLVTATNGNSIFFPASGFRSGSEVYNHGTYGGYWAGTINSAGASYATSLGFFSGSYLTNGYYYRSFGFPVRPVAES